MENSKEGPTLDEEYARKLQEEFDKEYKEEVEAAKGESEIAEIGEFVVQLLDDLWNNKNFKVVDDCFAEDCVSKGTLGESAGKKDFKTKIVLPLLNAFPDLKYVSHEIFQEGRRIVNRWTFSATHTGSDYLGIKNSGKKVSWGGVTINRFNEFGKLSEIQTFYDRMALLEQLKSGVNMKANAN